MEMAAPVAPCVSFGIFAILNVGAAVAQQLCQASVCLKEIAFCIGNDATGNASLICSTIQKEPAPYRIRAGNLAVQAIVLK